MKLWLPWILVGLLASGLLTVLVWAFLWDAPPKSYTQRGNVDFIGAERIRQFAGKVFGETHECIWKGSSTGSTNLPDEQEVDITGDAGYVLTSSSPQTVLDDPGQWLIDTVERIDRAFNQAGFAMQPDGFSLAALGDDIEPPKPSKHLWCTLTAIDGRSNSKSTINFDGSAHYALVELAYASKTSVSTHVTWRLILNNQTGHVRLLFSCRGGGPVWYPPHLRRNLRTIQITPYTDE